MSSCECKNPKKFRITSEQFEDGIFRIRCSCGGKYDTIDATEIIEKLPDECQINIDRCDSPHMMSKSWQRKEVDRSINSILFDSEIVSEGSPRKKIVMKRNRLPKLRKCKIIEFKNENVGQLFCECCNFNFKEKYGILGEELIIVHHKKQLDELDGKEITVEEALKNMVLVCANCHAIIHRTKTPLSIEKVIESMKKN